MCDAGHLTWKTDYKFMYCPALTRSKAAGEMVPSTGLAYATTYGLNNEPFSDVSKLKNPSTFGLFADTIILSGGYAFLQWYCLDYNSATDDYKIHLRHNNMANILFADGHVDGLNNAGCKELGFTNTIIFK